ncbi:MAG: hypothetical protein LBT52_00615, partial [Clostridiales Family XIII bacterium]|nr:hypothetical protein [Clostridiales Family XIII bacterium]
MSVAQLEFADSLVGIDFFATLFLVVPIVIVIILIVLVVRAFLKLHSHINSSRDETHKTLDANTVLLRDEQLRIAAEQRDEIARTAGGIREELANSSSGLREEIRRTLSEQSMQNEQKLENIRNTMEERIGAMQEGNERQLNRMRDTVDEKLQETLNKRISESFRSVQEQLGKVSEGLGEMQTLAAD